MSCKAPIREKLIENLYKKFGLKEFRYSDIQREIVEMHGLDYDEMEYYPTYDRNGNCDYVHCRNLRKHRGWYCDALFPVGHYYKNSAYLYNVNRNGLKLVRVSRGKYKLLKQSLRRND